MGRIVAAELTLHGVEYVVVVEYVVEQTDRSVLEWAQDVFH